MQDCIRPRKETIGKICLKKNMLFDVSWFFNWFFKNFNLGLQTGYDKAFGSSHRAQASRAALDGNGNAHPLHKKYHPGVCLRCLYGLRLHGLCYSRWGPWLLWGRLGTRTLLCNMFELDPISSSFASLSPISYFLHFWTKISELGPQNPSLGRKFHIESDFRDENCQFRRQDAKNEGSWPQKCRNLCFLLFIFLFFWS